MGNMGIIRGSGGGGGGDSQKPVESPDSLHSLAYARILDLVSEGEIFGPVDTANPMTCIFLNETPVANADGTVNFNNVSVDSRSGTMTQTPIHGFDRTENEITVGVELTSASAWVQDITNLDVSTIRIRLSTPTFLQTSPDNGNITGYKVDYQIWLSVDGGAFGKLLDGAFNGKTTSKYERTHLIDLPAATTKWTIKVLRVTANTTTSYIQDKTYVESYTEIVNVKMRMPMSAICGVVVDAKQFNNVPTRAYHVKGRLIQVPTNYDPDARTYAGVWDGTFKIAYSNNPAWVFYDMATNDRYGLGHLINPAYIDKWALYAIGQYCDELVPDGFGGTEPRFTANLYLQAQQDAYKVMQDMATIFRGIMYVAGGAITPCADRPGDPVYTYTPANVVGGRFSYSGSSKKMRHTVALVTWNDMTDFCRAKVEYVEDEEGILRYGVQPTEVVAVGSTSRGQAHRLGKYILATERYETDSVSFEVGLDGIIPIPGRTIKIADPLRAGSRLGGRLKNATLTRIYPDKMPDVVVGNKVTVILPTGMPEQRVVSAFGVDYIDVGTAFSAVPVNQSMWLLETDTVNAALYRAVGVLEKSDHTGYTVTGLENNADKYDFVDFGTKIDNPPICGVIPKLLMSPANIQVSKIDVPETNVTHKIITVTWDQVPGAAKYEVHWRQNNGAWHALPLSSQHSVEIRDVMTGPFEVQVTAITSTGIRSAPSYAGPFDVTANQYPPGFVNSLQTNIDNALTTAQNAQATADGKIVSFWQTTPPTIGSGAGEAKVGDIWFDTDDGNKVYRVVGGAWTLAADDDMAAALAAASDAQATADGKVQTFFQSTAPTATAVGDLWYSTAAKKLFRWDGSTWNQAIGDVTADAIAGSGVNLLWDEFSRLNNATLPSLSKAATVTTSYDSTKSVVSTNGSLKIAVNDATGNISSSWLYFGNSVADYNINLVAGRKYIVSAFVMSDNAAAQVLMAMKDSNGVSYNGSANAAIGVANAFVRVSFVVNMSASTMLGAELLIFCNRAGIATPFNLWIDRIMVEEQIGNQSNPSAWQPGPAGRQSLVAIANAATAQATADGKIDSWYQTSPPTIGTSGAKEGDIWFDTDDGNKIYTVVSGVWTATPDSRIAQALSDAAGAQATADGKVTTYYTTTTPTATAVGDLWYNTDTMTLKRWNGSTWDTAPLNSTGEGLNALPNPAFQYNTLNVPTSTNRAPPASLCDGWYAADYSTWSARADCFARYTPGSIRLRCAATTSVAAGATVTVCAAPINAQSVIANKTYHFGFVTSGNSFNGSLRAGINIRPRMTVRWYDSAGAQISYLEAVAGARAASGSYEGRLVAPSNAKTVRVILEVYVQNTTASAWDITLDGGTVAFDAFFTSAFMRQVNDLEVAGSGQTIGDQRNLPQSLTSSYGAVRNTTALSATSAGVVSVNAFSYRYGSVSISYNAVATAVSGLTPGTKYVIYCSDPSYAGGTKTWQAGTNPDAVMQLGDGIVVAGEITIPTSGTSSGGGGSSGGTNWCVDWDTVLPDGRLVRDLQVGDAVPCWNDDPVNPQIEYCRLLAINFGEEMCYRLVTDSFAAIVQSKSTPMTLRNGKVAYTDEMFGKELLVKRGNEKLRWEMVIDLQRVGVRRVVKISLGDRMYFAGETSDVSVATHNALQKP